MKIFDRKSIDLISRFLPPILWAGLIFVLSAQPALPGPETFVLDFIIKKIGHITVYLILYLLLYRAFFTQKLSVLKISILIFMIGFVYAMSDEWHQSFVPGRTPTIKDLGFDSLGMLIAWLHLHRYI